VRRNNTTIYVNGEVTWNSATGEVFATARRQRENRFAEYEEGRLVEYANTYSTYKLESKLLHSVYLKRYLRAAGKHFYSLAEFAITSQAVHPFAREQAKRTYPEAGYAGYSASARNQIMPIDFIFNHATLIAGLPASVCLLEPQPN